MESNFLGTLNIISGILPHMRARRSGTVVIVGSRSSWTGEVVVSIFLKKDLGGQATLSHIQLVSRSRLTYILFLAWENKRVEVHMLHPKRHYGVSASIHESIE
jgi:NAD(P)-dependent dehydrogenase (short-subunit alcohol dehydrogenase family)